MYPLGSCVWLYICLRLSVCVRVCQYLSKIPCFPSLVGVIQADLNLFSSVSSPFEKEVKLQ